MPPKREKKKRQPKSEYKLILAKLATLVSEAKDDADSEELVDLIYGVEKLGRKFVSDEGKEKGASYFKLAVDNLRKLAQIKQDQAQELNLHFSAGQTYALLGLLDDAVESYEHALQLSSKLNEYKIHARTLRLLGNLKLERSQWREAVACFEQSRKVCEENGEPLEEAYALNSLAAAYFQTAAWRKMESACEQALAIAEQMKDDELTACVNNNLGAMYSLQGQLDKAFVAFQKSLPIFEKLGDQRGLAETYNNLATTYRDKEMWHEAGKCYAKSLQLAHETGNVVLEACAKLNRVELYVLMHDLDLAEKQCQDAVRAFHGLAHKSGEADACKLLGAVYTKKENWGLARKYLDEALQINTQYRNRLGLAETHRRYAEFWMAKGNKKSAIAHLQKSSENYKSLKAHREIKKIEKQIKEIKAAGSALN
jgi:tetratricopeptide (TPR) repeat protein